MKEDGELEYNGRRSVSTRRMEMEQVAHAMPVLGYVACGEGQEETEQVIEYIRMPESLVGKGEFFALIAKGESMIDAGISPSPRQTVTNAVTTSSLQSSFSEKIWGSTISSAVVNRDLRINTNRM